MAILTLAQMETHARLLAQDSSASNPGLTQAQYFSLINEAAQYWTSEVSPRVKILSATASGATFATVNVKDLTDNGIADVLYALQATAAGNVTGTSVERVRISRMLELQEDATSSATITQWAMTRTAVGVATGGNQGRITIYIYPKATGTLYLALAVRPWHTDMAGTDVPDVSDEESRIIARMAATEAARLLGRDEAFINRIAALLPDKASVVERKNRNALFPQESPREELV
ncbi:MAG TPA: hypothetical protein VJ787_04715 [Thermoleophilia bacterium]|nr:hypothetical protein [Thermoleophilia bacterium]